MKSATNHNKLYLEHGNKTGLIQVLSGKYLYNRLDYIKLNFF
jgi:hypothetical protein